MKNLSRLFISIILLTSCASQGVNQVEKKEIALATQRVGEGFYNAGDYSLSLKNLLEAYETIPDDPYLNNSLGLVYLAKDRYDLAETHFKRALDLKKDYVDAKNNLGAAYLKQEKWALAVECFEDVSKNLVYASPEIPLSNLGWAYFHQKNMRNPSPILPNPWKSTPDFSSPFMGWLLFIWEWETLSRPLNFFIKS